MVVLVLNVGGSSLKYQLIDPQDTQWIIKGRIDRLGEPAARWTHVCRQHTVFPELPDDLDEITAFIVDSAESAGYSSYIVAHKIAFGGPELMAPTVLTESVISEIEKYSQLFPVHIPPAIRLVRAIKRLRPELCQIGVFEPGFHSGLPEYATVYGLPYDLCKRHGIRRYGFHGVSHSYVAERVRDYVPTPDPRIISCHLGSGTSVCGIRAGRSVAISSGLTPQSGTLMSTRHGDVDPAAILYLMQKESLSIEQMWTLLTRASGLLGISGISGDMRELEREAARGNYRAQLAIDAFCHSVVRFVGEYYVTLQGADVLAFTGGIGENSPMIRRRIAESLAFVRLRLDHEANESLTGEGVISRPDSSVAVVVIQADEEKAIALRALAVTRGG